MKELTHTKQHQTLNKKKLQERIAFFSFRLIGILVVGVLLWILGFIIYHGIGVISWEFLTEAPTDGMTGGGIFPAIVGTVYLILGSIAFAFPLGVMSAVYTCEYAGNGKIVHFIRIMTNNLGSVPSIGLWKLHYRRFVNFRITDSPRNYPYYRRSSESHR